MASACRHQVEAIDRGRALLCECPVWDEQAEALLWVDILGAQVHRLEPATGARTTLEAGRPVGALACRSGGGLVLAVEEGFASTDARMQKVRPIAALHEPGGRMRLNDGKCDPAGRFLAGTMAYDCEPGAGRLLRLSADGSIATLVDSVTIPNGLAWSDDGRTLYFVDSAEAAIDAFDYDVETGDLGRRRRVVAIPPGVGSPDGMTIDTDGCLWVAMWGGGAVRRYTPDGTLDQVVPLPTPIVTSCTFGGPALDTLFVTTARAGLAPERAAVDELAGAVFALDPGTTGRPARRFAG
jgi:sugar lactone lactonase YvrE